MSPRSSPCWTNTAGRIEMGFSDQLTRANELGKIIDHEVKTGYLIPAAEIPALTVRLLNNVFNMDECRDYLRDHYDVRLQEDADDEDHTHEDRRVCQMIGCPYGD